MFCLYYVLVVLRLAKPTRYICVRDGNWGCLAVKQVGNYSKIHDEICQNIIYVHGSGLCSFRLFGIGPTRH